MEQPKNVTSDPKRDCAKTQSGNSYTHKGDLNMSETEDFGYGICAISSDDGCIASVEVNGKTVKRFKGETAHMDANRWAGDLAAAERCK